ncbi:virion morhogenesis [Equine parapoxvirus]|nr:virion morhogenesis [Equine parapoxvirus]WOC35516.1 virion morhogenesis [Equine parapoxvirus]WOC35531.1 virion morhogenesis [Equine parapoxvirus]WOC35538.1 virion morhogenesis [Equine parapoxvirus]
MVAEGEDINEAALAHMMSRVIQLCPGEAGAAAQIIKTLVDAVNERIMALNKKAKKEARLASPGQ